MSECGVHWSKSQSQKIWMTPNAYGAFQACGRLPPTVAHGHGVGAISALRTSATESTTAAATITAIPVVATTTAVPNHFGEARINMLLGLLENTHEVASLL
jgi:hypothetical protein